MEKANFFIESPKFLSLNDFKNLRELYLPIVGITSIIIFESFYDLSESKDRKLFELNDFCGRLNINNVVFEDCISKLGAVGLVNSFKRKASDSYIFQLIKPFDIESFNKNPLLKAHLIKSIGNIEYEKIYFGQKEKFNSKYDYENITKKYQDVFSNAFQENILTTDDDYSTLEINIDIYPTHEENILKLHSSNFIKYLMKRNPSFYETQLINSLLKFGFTDSSINLLLNFSFKYNQETIVCPYIMKIAEDFRIRNILSFSDVRHEISIIEEHKQKIKKRHNKSELDNMLVLKTEKESDEANELISNTKEISISEIFSDDDIKGIF